MKIKKKRRITEENYRRRKNVRLNSAKGFNRNRRHIAKYEILNREKPVKSKNIVYHCGSLALSVPDSLIVIPAARENAKNVI